MRKTIAACLLLAGLVVPAAGQQLGLALWNAGYTRTLYLEATTHALTLGPFNPNAVSATERYGPAIDWHFSFGNTVGERASCETVDRFVAAGYLPGLGAGYHCTQFDLGDAKLTTRSGQRAAYDDMVAALGAPVTPPPVEPLAPVCPAGKSCLAPGEGCPPVVTCPPAPACPDCPPCPKPPKCPAPPPCPELASVPADIVPLLREILGYAVMGPGRHAKVQRVLDVVSTFQACKVVKP